MVEQRAAQRTRSAPRGLRTSATGTSRPCCSSTATCPIRGAWANRVVRDSTDLVGCSQLDRHPHEGLWKPECRAHADQRNPGRCSRSPQLSADVLQVRRHGREAPHRRRQLRQHQDEAGAVPRESTRKRIRTPSAEALAELPALHGRRSQVSMMSAPDSARCSGESSVHELNGESLWLDAPQAGLRGPAPSGRTGMIRPTLLTAP